MSTEAGDFWYRAARHAHEEDAKHHYIQLHRMKERYPHSFAVLLFQSPEDFSYYTVVAGNLPPRGRNEVKNFFRRSSVSLSPKNLAYARKLIAEQQRHPRGGAQEHKQFQQSHHDNNIAEGLAGNFIKSDAGRAFPYEQRTAQSISAAQNDQNFYEKKERLLRRVQAGIATQAQKDWLRRWGFLETPKPPPLKPTYSGSPTKTGPVYRYRGPMKATPVPGAGGSPPLKTSMSRKRRRGHQSVWAKPQTMR